LRIRRIVMTAAALALLVAAGAALQDRRFEVPVTLFYDEQDLSGAVVSRLALQSVVLAMEYFNSLPSGHMFVPSRESDLNVYDAIDRAVERGSAAVVGGINAPFSSLLADAARRRGIPFISLASGPLLQRADDLVFRPRPDNGARVLGRAAKEAGVTSYSVIATGFYANHTQSFAHGFGSAFGASPVGTTLLAGDLKKHMDEFDKISLRADAALLILPDWLAAVTVRELRLRRPDMPIYASDWAVSHRTPLLAGELGEEMLTASCTAPEWDDPDLGFPAFVRRTYTAHIPRMILAMGYDTVAMLDAAVRRAGSAAPKAVAAALKELDSVTTVGGPVPVDENGDMRTKPRLFSMKSGRWERIEAGPEEGAEGGR
jgi:ABC-type branched-subunit amino acid transport system substrate-binding protein